MTNISAFSGTIDRRAFVKELMELCPDALVVPGLGSSNYDLYAAGDRDQNFYMWGAMGGAALIGLGLALAQPNKSVLVITGDGEQLMGMGGLATINAQQPKTIAKNVLARAGVSFAQVYVKADDVPRAFPSRDGVLIKNRFRSALGLSSF